MQSVILPVLAAVASGIAAVGMVAMWQRLTKNSAAETQQESILVTRDDTNKTVVLPKKYSPSAVKALSELVA